MSLLQADALRIPLADGSVHCCVTSPPYWGLRDYGVGGQLGLEATPAEYVEKMVSVFREIWRVLRDDATCWLNLGDSYASDTKGQNNNGEGGSTLTSGARPHVRAAYNDGRGRTARKVDHGLKTKDLCGIPWRVAFALRADGWYLRSDIIWSKPNPMPESVTDRPTKAHEYLFLLAKQERYFYDAEAVKEEAEYGRREWTGRLVSGSENGDGHRSSVGTTKGGDPSTGRNRRTVWEIATAPYSGAHFATFPPALVEPCILAGTSAAGVCAECGAPWERVTEQGELIGRSRGDGHGYVLPKAEQDKDAYYPKATDTYKPNFHRERTTTGWRPTCAHAALTVPATVLDPFAGSGTTGQVARLHGRRFVGLDINGKYLRELALPRAEGRQTAASLATLPLFGGLLEPVGAAAPKQDQVGKRTYTGFNERWDAKHGA